MYKVENAIIMAAGKGERMQPVTLTTPKPLVRVNGVRMIDTVIQALHENGIYQIYIVVGYLKEQFAALKETWPGVELIENPYYDTCNNISSLYAARKYIGNTIILDGDQIIYDPVILKPEFSRSGYNAVWCENGTKEWLMQVNDEGIVTSCSRTGGQKGWQLFSISRWNKEDGERLRRQLEEEFTVNSNRQIYWDDVPMFIHFEDYTLGIVEMQYGDIVEIDDYEELISVDRSYAGCRKGA